MDVSILSEKSISTSEALIPEINYGHKIKPGTAFSISAAKIPNINIDYTVIALEATSLSDALETELALSTLVLMLGPAKSVILTPTANIIAKRKVVIPGAISVSISAAKRPALAIQGNIIYPADVAENKLKAPVPQLIIGYPATIQANISTSRSVALNPAIRFNLLDYISYGDDVYLLVSDDFGNTKIYRGIIRNRAPQDRLLIITAITGDGILSERVIKEDYPAQDIGLTAKEIIDTYCSPLTSNNINTNTGIVAPVPAKKKTPLRAFESLRREHGINYFVDYSWDVHLYLSREIEPSGVEEDQGYKIKLGDEV